MPRASPCTAKSKQTCQEKLTMDKFSNPAILQISGFLEIAGSKHAGKTTSSLYVPGSMVGGTYRKWHIGRSAVKGA